MSRVKEGADIIRAALNEVKLIKDADAAVRRSQDILDKLLETAATLESPGPVSDSTLQDLRQLDAAHRNEVHGITEIKVCRLMQVAAIPDFQ